jgi:purine-nucleoside phosphorylase
MELKNKIEEAARFLRKNISDTCPEIAVILGSGLGSCMEKLTEKISIDVSHIPHWPVPAVQGHRGRLVAGRLDSVNVWALQGRIHFYEGHSIRDVIFPIRILGKMGVRSLIVTNAAGGLHPDLDRGDVMVITDHINLMGVNPLVGEYDSYMGDRFPDMSEPYDSGYIALSQETAREMDIDLKKGVLIAVSGPSYETAAEVRMMQTLGGDAVCMSTVPEVIAGVQMGMRILGLSCITNKATGLTSRRLSHEEVEKIPPAIRERFGELLTGIIHKLVKGNPH